MRTDMAKVIVERRRGGGHRNRKGRQRDFAELPTKESTGRGISDPKGSRENFAPLRRFLASKVGRPWDKVYAEICVNLNPASAVQQHVRSHLADLVALKVRVNKAGILEYHSEYNGPKLRWGQRLYVDPRDGLLKRTVN